MHHIIVPGWNGSDGAHWQSVWESDWLQATRIEPASWTHPDRDDWTAALDRAVQKADDDVVFIAHSLGCFAVAHWLTRTPDAAAPIANAEPGRAAIHRVRGVFLVAPPDQQADTFPAETLASFIEPKPVKIDLPAVLIASEDDPYCLVDGATRMAGEWQIPLITIGRQGHINSDSDLGPWPLGQNLLTAFEAGLGSRAS
jgi:predicted alpha/beta hydrolase family esterase